MRRTVYSDYSISAAGSTRPQLTDQEIADINSALGGALDDNILTGSEKSTIFIPKLAELDNAATNAISRANSAGLSVTDLNNADTALDNYLLGLTPDWDDTTQDTAIDRDILNNLLIDYSQEINNLEADLTNNAATTANWSGVEDDNGNRPEDNATFGAPAGSPVGDRNAELINSQIDSHETEIADLITTYGSTAAASTSAQIAQDAATNAQTAEANTQTALGDAQDAVSAAEAARDIASTKAGEADQDAQAAAGSAAAASVSENAAGISASAAEVSRVEAANTRANLPPRLISEQGWTQAQQGTPETRPDLLISGIDGGREYKDLPDGLHIWHKAVLPATPGEVYEFIVDVAEGGLGYPIDVQVGFWYLDKDYIQLPGVEAYQLQGILGITEAGPQTSRVTVLDRTPSGAVFLRPVVKGRSNGNTPRVYAAGVQNVTALAEAENEAQAAASSATTAAISETNAGQSASAAQTSETNASTSASNAAASESNTAASESNASTSASNASTSETNAAGSAATATTQAGLAADSESAAGVSASAAATSAGTATTRANEAANSASAALSAQTAAEIAEGNAATSASTATTQAANASASASSAASSEALSASYASEAQDYATPSVGMNINSDFESPDNTGWYKNYERTVRWTSANQGDNASHGGVLVTDLGAQANIFGEQMPIDTSRTYDLKFRLWCPDANTRVYAGFAAFDGNGNLINGYRYAAASNQKPPASTWTDYTATVTGEGGLIDTFPAGTKSIALMAFINYNNEQPGRSLLAEARILDVTESTVAATQAAIATTKAAEASADAASAATSETLAAGHASDAATDASISTTQAVIATDKAAAASASAEIAASISGGTYSRNPNFTAWDNPSGLPAAFNLNAGGSVVTRIDTDADVPQPYILRHDARGLNTWFFTDQSLAPSEGDWVVTTAEFTLVEGKLDVTEIRLRERNASGSFLRDTRRLMYLTEDVKGVVHGSGVVGARYKYEFLVQLGSACERTEVLAMTKLVSAASGPDTSTQPTIDWHYVGTRFATRAEIEAEAVLPALEASVSVNQGAIANIEGSAAFLAQIVAASGSNPAMMQLLAGQGGSAIGLVADRIALGNDVDGIIENVLTIENGQARLNEALIRRLAVAPTDTSQIFHEVQLKPLIFLAGNGDVVQYQDGDSYGQNPDRVEVDISNLPTLATGESYDVRATNITPTQFTAKVVKKTSGSTALQTSNAGSNVGGTPQWQTNKPTAADAFDGYYEYRFSGTIPKVSEIYEPEFGTWDATYRGTFNLYGKNASGNWVILGSVLVTHAYSDSFQGPATWSVTRTVTVQSSVDFGSGANHFGIHPPNGGSVWSFNHVKYTSQTSTTETAISDRVPFYVYPPVPE